MKNIPPSPGAYRIIPTGRPTNLNSGSEVIAKRLAGSGHHERAASIFLALSGEPDLAPHSIKESLSLAAKNFELAADQSAMGRNCRMASIAYNKLARLGAPAMTDEESKSAFAAAARNCELSGRLDLAAGNWEDAAKKAAGLGQLAEAQDYWGQALKNFAAAGNRSSALFVAKKRLNSCRDLGQKFIISMETAEIVGRMGERASAAYFIETAAETAREQGRTDMAIELYDRAWKMLEKEKKNRPAAFACGEAAKLCSRPEARTRWLKAAALWLACDPPCQAEAGFAFARAAENTDDPEERVRLWRAANDNRHHQERGGGTK
ncbi:MAG: hypothetical protein JW873_04140 [Candidatus Saganbacteria bacterium]|nr:hypothetical protein [Candidatus Saganbacteria bacterium]